jgi:hypothetical protein
MSPEHFQLQDLAPRLSGHGRARGGRPHDGAAPWLTTDTGWVPASSLKVGEPVRLLDGRTATMPTLRYRRTWAPVPSTLPA